jgi:hypothetical protein
MSEYIISYFHGVTWVVVKNKSPDDEIMEQIQKYKSLLISVRADNINLLYDLMNKLPVELENLYLEVNEEWGKNIKDNLSISMDMLPLNLKYLQIDISTFDESLDNLPSSLKTLIIGSNNFNKTLNNLPSTLERLEINSAYTIPIENIPLTLKFLNISPYYPYLKDIKKKIPKIIFNNGNSRYNNI